MRIEANIMVAIALLLSVEVFTLFTSLGFQNSENLKVSELEGFRCSET
jgi:hypothetical protein